MDAQKYFGILVRSLLDDRGWSEYDIAEKVGMTRSRIKQIISGHKKKLNIEDLTRLADAFDLTSVMRREFFLAAVIGDEQVIARPANEDTNKLYPDAETAKTELLKILASLRVPAFVTDVYCDIVAANELCIRMLNAPKEMIENANAIPAGGNSMRYVFDRRSGFKKLVGDENWEQNLWMNMNYYLCNSIRYRADSYWIYTKQALLTDLSLPKFRDYWERFSKEIKDHYMDMDPVEIKFSLPGQNKINMQYVITQSLIYTNRGELVITTYLPSNPETAMLFTKLDSDIDEKIRKDIKAKRILPKDAEMCRVREICSWPDKKQIKKGKDS